MSDQADASRRWAVVTGASGGIGRDLAGLCAADGYDVVVVARSQAELEALAEELRRDHDVAVAVAAMDLSEPGAAARLHAQVAALGGRVEALINNAGFGLRGRFAETPLESEAEMIRLNVVALTELTKLFLGGMLAAGRGYVLNVASTAAFQPGPTMAVYYATKAYVLSFTEALAHELRGTGVSATALCPGATATGFAERADMERSRLFRFNTRPSRPVAETGYRAMKAGRVVVVPGLSNKLGVMSIRFSPRPLIRSMVAYFQGDAG